MDATTDTGTGNLTQHTGDLPFCVANATAGDVVEFDSSLNNQTIYLSSEIQVSQAQAGLLILGGDPDGDLLNITIDGQANTRLFEILGNANATIEYLRLTGGYSSDNGGAVLVDANASLSAYADTFTDNSAEYNGGAIENDGTANVWTCAFSDNTAGGNGGAIENTNQLTVTTPTTTPGYPPISNFVGNTAVGMGGAIDSADGGLGQLNVSYTNFYSNTAANGGGISTVDATTLDTDIFGDQGKGNSATSLAGNGGAVYALQNPNAENPTQLYASNCTFDYNTAAGTGSGGAIYTTMDTDVESSTFNTNSTVNGDGGAIEAIGIGTGSGVGSGSGSVSGTGSGSGSSSGFGSGSGSGSGIGSWIILPSLTINNSTFMNQTANGGNGGAVNTLGGLSLSNDTFTSNQAVGSGGNGGAVYAAQDPNAPYPSQLYASNCTFDTDQAGGSGGAICTNMGADVENCTLDNNSAGSNGGAIDYGDLSDMVSSPTSGSLEQLPTISTASSANAFVAAAAPVNPRYTPTGPFRLFNDKLSNNFAEGNGGAINSHGNGAGNLTLTNVQFTKCNAQNGGAIATNDPTNLTEDTFGDPTGDPLGLRGNTATQNGGAIYALPGGGINPSILRVSQSTFVFSSAGQNGGAIYTNTTTQVRNSLFQNGKAPVSGGAISANLSNAGMTVAAAQTFSLTLDRDLFEYNSSQYGGAVADYMDNEVRGTFSTDVNNCTFDNNTAVGQNRSPGTPPLDSGNGGGLYVDATSNATSFLVPGGRGASDTTALLNDTFVQNTSDGHGGGLALHLFDIGFAAGANTVSLTSLTVTQNTAANDSGGLFVDSDLAGSVTVTNCILSGNKLTAAPKGPVDATFFAKGALDPTNAALQDGDYNLVGTTDTMFDPKKVTHDIVTDQGGVGALANNGGPLVGSAQTTTLPTCAVPVVSPAYRQGNPAEAFLFDERGFQRNGVNVSIGAEDPDAAP